MNCIHSLRYTMLYGFVERNHHIHNSLHIDMSRSHQENQTDSSIQHVQEGFKAEWKSIMG